MKRFILLSFVFLGLAFYHLSGGKDFDPDTARLAAIEARQDRKAIRKASIPVTMATRAPDRQETPDPVVSEDAVTRTALNLVSFASLIEEPAAPQPVAKTADTPKGAAAPEDSAAPPATESIASLAAAVSAERSIVFPGTTISSAPQALEPAPNLRTVKGTRVNLRAGPGTNFGVISQLMKDAEVEILNDNGTGWVQLRPLAGGPTGWMADYLLTDG